MSRLQLFARAGIAVVLCALAGIVSTGQEREPRVKATGPAGPAAAVDRVEVPQAVAERPADVVLLRNGRVLQGWARREGDSYVVERPGAEMRLAASSVEMVGRSLEELYARRRRQIAPDDINAHLALVHWCLRHELLDEARLELAAVMAQEPDNTVAKQLLLRLEGQDRLSRSAELQSSEAAQGKIEAEESPGAGEGAFEAALAEESSAQQRRAAAPRGPAHAGPSVPPYEWPGVPERTISEFTRTIQPLLNNSCTTGGCHSAPGRDRFGLIRIRDPRLVTRKATEQNLASVLEWIDPQEPNNSEFLAMAVLAHARGLRPQFQGLRGEQFDALARWIDSLEPTQDEADWAARRPGRPTAAFQAAMRADAAAPGRRGETTGRSLSRGHARETGIVAGAAHDVQVQTQKPSEAPAAEEVSPRMPEAPTAPRRARDSLNAEPVPAHRRPMQRSGNGEGGLELPPGPGQVPNTGLPRSTPRVSADDESLPSGPMVPSVADPSAGEGARKAPFSNFLKRLNPFRRKR